jgi:hypothetical protein
MRSAVARDSGPPLLPTVMLALAQGDTSMFVFDVLVFLSAKVFEAALMYWDCLLRERATARLRFNLLFARVLWGTVTF